MKTKNLIKRQTNLPAHVIQFCRFLRDNNFVVGIGEECDLLEVYHQFIPTSFDEQKNLYKSILVKNRKQFILFNELYQQYWTELSRAEDSKTKDHEEKKKQPQKSAQQKNTLQVLKKWLHGGRIDEEKEVSTYSAFEAISNKDFSTFLTGEQKQLLEIIKIISQRLANRNSRRYIGSKSKKQIDLKKTIRQSLRKDAEINQFFFKEQQQRKVNLVLICDVSKSMELYSQFLIEFMYSFQQAVNQLRTFVFSTRLVSLSNVLKDGDYEKVLNNLSDQVPYWSGGTRIGESLQQFNERYASRMLNKNSIVIIMSDGWDTGDLAVLENAMKSIHKKSDRVIWLNPLAGNPEYKPSTKGMEICLPYIDVFTSAHNLESLKSVVKHLKQKKYKPKFS
ncbi:MAG: VWA domain-containing protein [Saprospiraceae bacterium]